MKIRRIRIWLSRGWYRVVYSVSFLVLSFLCSCSSSKSVAKEKTEGSKGVEASKDKEPADSTKTGVSVINMEDFQGLGIETPEIRLMYGVPSPVQERRLTVPKDSAKSKISVSGSKPKAGDIISGVIRDASGPMVMVNITERDSLYRIVAHAVSDVNGEFAFRLVNPADRLSVTYVGYGEAITDITGSFFEVTMVERQDIPVVDILNNTRQTAMYGPPLVNYNRYYDPNAQPAVRDFIEIGARTPDVSVMYGVPRPVLEKENLSGGDEMTEVADGSELADSASAVFDSIRLDTEYLRTHMRLMYGVQPPVSREEFAPLIIYDGNPVEVDKEKYAAFDWEKDIYSKKKVAALLGVKKKAVKASRVVTDRTSLVAIWGSRGRNGTFEVISYDAEEHNRLATSNFFQPLK